MDRTELIGQLQAFTQVCGEKGYIDTGDKDAVYLEEAYPGMIPTSFVVNVVVKQPLLEVTYGGNVLKELIGLLWETTTPEIRENIFTLSLYGEDERHFLVKEAA
ncbi:hypothetical protein [Methylovulum psychrotolerans]|uniref:Uncharacterized protein n=1 Tax=Methylovulum psychrotolerans TaxID=1704499 RepID=A0A2S5CLP5_9GAMM|nr:hypothetical protein [Methylovulum psychrotolerans]MBT9097239.1 hypothetical protein [Methylovulum psychrotolerans]POZ51714.1 hypothetical protein AADEFJLK_02584 [Methylovulum psychrotolerans]